VGQSTKFGGMHKTYNKCSFPATYVVKKYLPLRTIFGPL